jgi:hypothetical protein
MTRPALACALALASAGAALAAPHARLPARSRCSGTGAGIIFVFQQSGYVAEATVGRTIAARTTPTSVSLSRTRCRAVAALAVTTKGLKRFPYAEGVVGCPRATGAEVQIDAVPGGYRVDVFQGHASHPIAVAVTARRASGMWFDAHACRASP